MSSPEKESSPSDGLRRSKRNKFHLDVVALCHGSSNPDRRRSNLDAKYEAKEANHASVKRNSTGPAPTLSPMEPVKQDELEDRPGSPASIASSSSKSGPPQLTQDSIELETSVNNNEKPIEELQLEEKIEPEELTPEVDTTDASEVKEDKEDSPAKEDFPKPGTSKEATPEEGPPKVKETFTCPRCKCIFKSKAGGTTHAKYCRPNDPKNRRRRLKRQRQQQKEELLKINENDQKQKTTPTPTLDSVSEKSMPLLVRERSVPSRSSSRNKNKSNPAKAGDKRKAETPKKSKLLPGSALKKINLPPVPFAILKPLDLKYACCECPFKSMDNTMYKLHRRLHMGLERLYRCPMCTYSCFSPDSLRIHLDLHLPRDQQEAKKKKNKRRNTIEIIPANAKNVIECNLCNYRTQFPDKYKVHQNDHVVSHQKRLNSIIKRNPNLKNEPEEILAGPSTEVHVCRKCNFEAENAEFLTHHEEFHGSGQLYTCELCDYSSDSKSITDFHEKHHHYKESLLDILKREAIKKQLNDATQAVPKEKSC